MKTSIPQINIADYDYPLPEARIAKYPLPRGQAKLLIYRAGQITERPFQSLQAALPPKACLLFNQTKVVQARLLFPKNAQSLIEVFCLEPLEGQSVEQAMQQRGRIVYRCLVGGARKWKDQPLRIELGNTWIEAHKQGRHESGDFLVELRWDETYTFGEILDLAGKTPLPPYLKRQAEAADQTTYQTVYALHRGSVAAPTAGLHFSESHLAELQAAGVERLFLTLHVGAGTFKPVSSDQVAEHQMHAEEIHIDRTFLRQLIDKLTDGSVLIPVGTTSLRALESSYWLACLLAAERCQLSDADLAVPQWAGFDPSLPQSSPALALRQLLSAMEEAGLEALSFRSSLIIAPGYQHRLIGALITNFHQPRSTLLLLIASLVGEKWRAIYDHAFENDFRFLSYGDSCLIFPDA